MSAHERKAVGRIYAAFARWDVEEMLRDVTHDFELRLPDTVPFGGTRHGPFVHVWSFSEGVPSRCRSYFDTAPVMAALEG